MDQGFGGPSVTNVLLYSFLENSPDSAYLPELRSLRNQLKAPEPCVHLQGALQTDGNRSGRFQVPEPGDDEEIFRIIGAQLAEIGDRLALEIEPSFMNNLVQQFMVENFSREEITRHLSVAVQTLVRRMPVDRDRDRSMLLVAMVLARNVARTAPSLLHRVFSATVNYINCNLRDYVNSLASEG
ncbi:BH3-interacting domain death agonist [Paroedura picta]|uniref:BH3-interacting domain death agonist n=1 Tax=Paroedura picta TaxID=143630 RepID=UPI0040563B9B